MNDQIEKNFTYHVPTEDDISVLSMIRQTAKDFVYLLDEFCPDSRERSLAITKIEESVMWANASIVRNKTTWKDKQDPLEDLKNGIKIVEENYK